MASLESLYEALDRKDNALRNIKNKEKSMTAKVVDGCLAVGGGVAAGYVDGKWPQKTIAGVKIPIVGGAALAMVDLAGWAGKTTGGMLGSLGVGMLAGEGYAWGQKKGATSGQQSPPPAGAAGVGAGSDSWRLGGPVPSSQDLVSQFQQVAAGYRR
jgi:hypothetical protein